MTKTIQKLAEEDGYESRVAEFEKSPDMLALDTLTRKVLLLRKGEQAKSSEQKKWSKLNL